MLFMSLIYNTDQNKVVGFTKLAHFENRGKLSRRPQSHLSMMMIMKTAFVYFLKA